MGEDAVHVRGLTIAIEGRVVVDDATFSARAGALTGLVGMSGSGKTLCCRALLGMVDARPGVIAGDVIVEVGDQTYRPYETCRSMDRRRRDRAFSSLRGAVLGWLPQDAPAGLDPFARVRQQVIGAARLAGDLDSVDPVSWLVRAGFTAEDAVRVAASWPHQLSGGMAQRVGIACALARGGRFLIADEPTTGLDAPLQQRILRTLRELADRGIGVLVVTHDLPSLVPLADTVVLMDAGQVVETLTQGALRQGRAESAAGRRLFGAVRGAADPWTDAGTEP